jgi:hypothetical protein
MNAKLKERLKHLILSINNKGSGRCASRPKPKKKSVGGKRKLIKRKPIKRKSIGGVSTGGKRKSIKRKSVKRKSVGGVRIGGRKKKSVRAKSIMGVKRIRYSPKISENYTQGGVRVNPTLLYGIDVGPKYKSSNGGRRMKGGIKSE